MQLNLFGPARATPAGFVYREELLTRDEEEALLRRLARLEYGDFVMHGVAARRKVAYFGYGYGPVSRTLGPGEPMPEFLRRLRERCAGLAEIDPGQLEMGLVIQYPPGAGIGWHRDAPPFGLVTGVSLLSPCRFKLRQSEGGEQLDLVMPPRSGYVLSGAARWQWQHAIPRVKALRYSVTFRTLKGAGVAVGR